MVRVLTGCCTNLSHFLSCQLENAAKGQAARMLPRGVANSFNNVIFSCLTPHYLQPALYNYLKPLQGDVLPWIIGVHVLPGAISIAMEPPHHSFWVEAAADMPTVLKQRCIEAFEKIHERGVLHGNVELRHMLIGGDGKVTIIDFQMSRALVPNSDMLLPAESEELALEMRRVKYKLDYAGARKIETEKMMRNEERERRRAHQIGSSAMEAHYEDVLEEDIIDPPVSTRDWNESWANAAAKATPTRFVMPGQTSEALAKEVRSFLIILDRISTGTTPGGHRQVRFASEVTSVEPVDTLPSQELVEAPTTQVYGMQKRKLSESAFSGSTHDPRFAKRSRSDGTSTPSMPVAEDEDEDEPIRPGLRADPILAEYMANNTADKDRFTPPRTAPTDVFQAPESQSSNPSPRFPPIKIRDFAYEPYDGPRGYYAPYPLMESVVSLNRRRWIRTQDERRRAELGLPHPRRSTGAASRSLNASTRKPTKSEKHLIQLALGLGVVRHQAMLEVVPTPTWKRKRGDEEAEMVEAGVIEDNRYAKKILTNTDRNARRLSGSMAGPSSRPADRRSVPGLQERTASQQSQERRLHQLLGPRSAQFVKETSQNKSSAAGDRIAFATLGRPRPTSRTKANSEAQAQLSSSGALGASYMGPSVIRASRSRGATPPRRKNSHRTGVIDTLHTDRARRVERCVSPSSEDEVESLLHPSRIDISPPPSLIPLAGWMGFLLHWIR